MCLYYGLFSRRKEKTEPCYPSTADGNGKFYRLTFRCKRCIILVDRKDIKDITMSQAQGQTDADDFIA